MLKRSVLLSLIAAATNISASQNLNINWINADTGQFTPAEAAVINSAISDWESILYVPVPHSIDIRFDHVPIPDALGQAYEAEWNHLGMPASGLIEISNSFDFFIDPTPNTQSEFVTPTTNYTYDAQSGSPAYNKWDLKTVVLHEIGHALGFNASFSILESSLNPNNPNNPIQLDNQTLNLSDYAHLDHDTDLMGNPGFNHSQRSNVSDINQQFLNKFYDYNNTQYFTADTTSHNINDTLTDGTNTTYINLQFVNEHFSVQDVDLALRLDHEYITELEVTLISPDGTEVLLFSADDFYSDDDEWARFNDEIDDQFKIEDAANQEYYNLHLQPRGLLSDFDSKDAYGQWQLKIVDLTPEDQGFFHDATLILTDPNILADFNDDNQIDQTDFDMLADSFGTISYIDINDDNYTGLDDLFALRNSFIQQDLINSIQNPQAYFSSSSHDFPHKKTSTSITPR